MNAAFGLPEIEAHKSLLWKHGGHPRQHRCLETAHHHLKLANICALLSEEPDACMADPTQLSILRELKLLEEADPVNMDIEEHERGTQEERCLALLTGLMHNPHLRRYLDGPMVVRVWSIDMLL